VKWMWRAAALLMILTPGVIAVVVFKNVFTVGRTGPAIAVDAARTSIQDEVNMEPVASPDGKLAAYSAGPSGMREIYVRKVDRPQGTQLTSDGGDNVQPAWSPDGKTIAFASRKHGGVWIVSADGGKAKQLTTSGSAPQWSGDGKSVSFHSNGNGGEELRVDPATGKIETLAGTPAQ
jgi:Tol biopolymer transport system component